jgi:hypothetical protein
MKSAVLVVLAAIGPALFAAGDEKGELPPEAFQSWIHSNEEDEDSVQAYRPKGFDFPPSRGRDGFVIEKDGTFIDRPIAPTDGNETVPGKWESAGEGKVVVTFPKKPHRKPFTLEIVSCDGKVLKVKRTEAK